MSKRQSKIDPLDLLREFTIGKKQIKCKDGYLTFDQNKYKLNTVTCFKAKNSQKQYNLGSLWLLIDNRDKDLGFKQYSQLADQYQVERITKIDQQDVISYFTGKVDFTESIDLDIKQNLMNVNRKQTSKNIESFKEEKVEKKIKLNDGSVAQPPKMSPQEENLSMMRWLSQCEKPISTKTRLLRNTSQKKFSSLLLYLNNLAERGSRQQSSSASAKQLLSNCLLKNIYVTKRKPIIVVPQNHAQGNISIRNFKQLMVDGVYEDPTQTQFRCREGVLEIKKEINGQNIRFDIIDNIGSIRQKNEWDRIVAVFISGSKYQFNTWPDGDKNSIFFTKKRGYYIHYTTNPPNDFVKSCNYKSLEIQESNRGNDKMIRDVFWRDLEAFLLKAI